MGTTTESTVSTKRPSEEDRTTAMIQSVMFLVGGYVAVVTVVSLLSR